MPMISEAGLGWQGPGARALFANVGGLNAPELGALTLIDAGSAREQHQHSRTELARSSPPIGSVGGAGLRWCVGKRARGVQVSAFGNADAQPVDQFPAQPSGNGDYAGADDRQGQRQRTRIEGGG